MRARGLRCSFAAALLCAAGSLSLPGGAAASPGPQPASPREPASAPALSVMAAPSTPRPWARGVSAERQAAARRAYAAGNRAFARKAYSVALMRYQRALKAWRHPAIHFNAAQCLRELHREVEAHEQLQAALRYGDAALGAVFHRKARAQLVRLDKLLVRLELSCSQPGVTITLDGRRVTLGPQGRRELRLRGGRHQLVAKRRGFVTLTRDELLVAGSARRVEISLSRRRVLRRRWSLWTPWVVVGTGVAVAVSGVALWAHAQGKYNDVAAGLGQACPVGCTRDNLPEPLASTLSSGETFEALAISAFALGGAIALGGVVMALLNQPRSVAAPLGETETPRVSLAVDPRFVGLSIGGRF